MFAWCFHRTGAASSGTTTTAPSKGPARCRTGSNSRCDAGLVTAACSRPPIDERLTRGIAMVRISAGSAIRTFIPAIALLAPLLIGASALAQELRLTRTAASGVESPHVDDTYLQP